MGRDPEVFRNDTTISGALLYCRLQRWNSGNHWFWKSVLYMFFFCSLFWVFWVELLIKSVLTSKRHKWSIRHLGLTQTALHGLSPDHALASFPATLPTSGILIPTMLNNMQVPHYIVLLYAAVLFPHTAPSTWNTIPPFALPNSSPHVLMIISGVTLSRGLSWAHLLPLSASLMCDAVVGI